MREFRKGDMVWIQIGGINRQMEVVEVSNKNVTFEYGTTRIVTARQNVFPVDDSNEEILYISDLED